ncbi:MAG: DNA gyrase inhibitor YacG [Thiotrichales bacterium]|nr:DNA gyrase inhibitor YacG [Thiotrichales bacterium]
MKKGRCPCCKQLTDYSDSNPLRPFCSKRCKIIDLGDWLSERHRIPGTGLPAAEEHDPDLIKH